MTKEGINRLFGAILERAVEDYKSLLRHKSFRREASSVNLSEIENFFHSDWFGQMVDYNLDGDQVIKMIRKQERVVINGERKEL